VGRRHAPHRRPRTGWWRGDAELAYWALITGAVILATTMLLPQIFMWISLPSGDLRD
jgi:hypothetical protein